MSKLTFSQFLRNLVSESDVFGKKHALNRELWEKSGFESIFYNASDFYTKNYFVLKCNMNIHKASKMNQDFNNASDFDEKTVFTKWKSVVKLALKECFIWSVYTIKTSKLAFFCIHGKVVPGKVVLFLYKIFLDKNFSKYSVFESFVVQRLIFWIKNFKCVRLRAVFSQLDKFRIENFWTCQISEKKLYNASDFEVKLICKKNRFWWKFCFQTITSGSLYPKKCHFWQLCVFSKTNICFKK